MVDKEWFRGKKIDGERVIDLLNKLEELEKRDNKRANEFDERACHQSGVNAVLSSASNMHFMGKADGFDVAITEVKDILSLPF